MNLTIAELAVAVDRSETYIRQHIHRKHLAILREGRRVYVEPNEARRWARERGIPFRMPASATAAITSVEDRMARMTVLVWKEPNGPFRNLFTLVRYRRKEGMGPWWSEPDEDWRIEELAGDLHLLSFDASWQRCESIINRVLDSGSLQVEGLEVRYALESVPRRHWAYRDERQTHDHSLRSPFKRHSAEILEYWSFAVQPRKHWQEELEASLSLGRSEFARLGFPLDLRSDRVGNLMIARAEDAITCDLQANRHDRTLTFHVEADAHTHGAYRGSVWAGHSGDEVLRREIAIVSGETLLELESDIDSIGFEVFRIADGQCTDLMSHHLIMEVSLSLNLQTGPTLRLQDRKGQFVHEVNPSRHVSTIRVSADDHDSELDRRIRQQRLDYLYHRASVRERGAFCRFESGKWAQAADHFLGILAADMDPPSPIYFADPYFMYSVGQPEEIKLWLDVFDAMAGGPLHILCGKGRSGGGLPPWWDSLKSMNSHVRVRLFTQPDNRDPAKLAPAFHDRYLITPTREVLITNSVSGWASDGVTFAILPSDVYRAEAERLWGMDPKPNSNIKVEELC